MLDKIFGFLKSQNNKNDGEPKFASLKRAKSDLPCEIPERVEYFYMYTHIALSMQTSGF